MSAEFIQGKAHGSIAAKTHSELISAQILVNAQKQNKNENIASFHNTVYNQV